MTDEPRADLRFRVALHRIHRLGSMRFGLLDRFFPDMDHAWRASLSDLAAAGLDARTAHEVQRAQQEIDPDVEMERLDRAGVRALAAGVPGFPGRLGEIHDAPPLLYVLANGAPRTSGASRWSAPAARRRTGGRRPPNSLAGSPRPG